MTPPTPSADPGAARAAADRLVTVAAFSQPIEAHLARGRLECEGIGCVLADEHFVGIHAFASAAVGGVKLQVREADRELALRVLEQARRQGSSSEWVTGDLAAPRCPSCGSLRVDGARLSRRLAGLSWLLLGIPLPVLRRRAHCERCGARWRTAPSGAGAPRSAGPGRTERRREPGA